MRLLRMDEEKPKECYFCHTPKFEFWRGSHGLRGLRCENRCIHGKGIYIKNVLAVIPN